MAYPEPLEFTDEDTGVLLVTTGLLHEQGPTSHIQHRVAVLSIREENDYPQELYLTPTTRDAMIDWLVAQREAERTGEQEKSKHGLCLLPVDGDLCELRCGHTGPCAKGETP